jgi:SAM-dependent methyltransferase
LNGGLAIYDTQVPFYAEACAYPIPDLLAACPNVTVQTSLFHPEEPWGAPLGSNCTNQTLERLTFPDASFDIVVTSDVLEHVRLDDLAHREIRRVLKPGGIHIFTVPNHRHVRETLKRVTIVDRKDPSRDEYPMEKEFHDDGNAPEGRALAYRVYGTELDEMLRDLGFSVDYTREDFPRWGIQGTELFYCRLR